MKVKNVIGYFDCRKYVKNVQRASRQMVEADGRINLSVMFTDEQLPAEIAEFANKSKKSGINYVTFKVFTKNCKIYTAVAKLVPFPKLENIDGGKFEVNIDFSIKHGTGTELNGCYANAIQVLRRADNPFDVEDGYSEDVFSSEQQADPFATPTIAKPVVTPQAPAECDDDDLPF